MVGICSSDAWGAISKKNAEGALIFDLEATFISRGVMDDQLRSDLVQSLSELAQRRCRPDAGYDAADLVQVTLLWLEGWLETAGVLPLEEIAAQGRTFIRYLTTDDRLKATRVQRKEQSIEDAGLADRLEDQGPSPSWEARQEEKRAAVREAIEHLPPRQQELMRLLYEENLTQAEAAERLGVTPASVSMLKDRLRRGLVKWLPADLRELD
jgi:RNA polymerase sigma factor (sigma-70 family)